MVKDALQQELVDFKLETFKRLDRIESQTALTNGRVTSNEKKIGIMDMTLNNLKCDFESHLEEEKRIRDDHIKWSRERLLKWGAGIGIVVVIGALGILWWLIKIGLQQAVLQISRQGG